MTALTAILLGAAPGYGAGIAALVAVRKSARRQALALKRLREEIEILLVQHQTEYRDGIGDVGHAVQFLEESAQQTEDVLRERLSPSQRARVIQLLRSGLSAEKAASSLAIPRSDVRLIATISRLCQL